MNNNQSEILKKLESAYQFQRKDLAKAASQSVKTQSARANTNNSLSLSRPPPASAMYCLSST